MRQHRERSRVARDDLPPPSVSGDMSSAIPIVFIPALFCDEAMYAALIAELGASHRTHVLVGRGRTVAESVAAILGSSPERFVLVGSSYGGIIATELALAAPGRVAALCLAGVDPGAPNVEQSQGFATLVEGSTEAAIAHLASLVVRPDATAAARTFREMAARIGGVAAAAGIRALGARASAWERLGELTMPALIIWGADDALFPLAVGERLAAMLPHARLEVIAGSGHLPMLEAPHAAAAIMERWMSIDVQASVDFPRTS